MALKYATHTTELTNQQLVNRFNLACAALENFHGNPFAIRDLIRLYREAERRTTEDEYERRAAESDEAPRTVEIHEIYTSKRRYYSIRFDNGREYKRSMKRGEALKKKLHLVPGSGGCKFSTTPIL